MEQKVSIDWKTVAALGVAASLCILAVRMPASATGSAYNQLVIAASHSLAIADPSVC